VCPTVRWCLWGQAPRPGTRREVWQYHSSYHASIIAYVPDSVAQSAAVNDPHFQVALQKAGHKLVARAPSGCAGRGFESGKYDIILVDLEDEAMVDKQVAAAAVNTVVMPVVYDGADLKQR